MVLGIQWLVELGPIVWDFKNLIMKFIVDGRKFMLRGAPIGPTKLVSTYQIQKDLFTYPRPFVLLEFCYFGTIFLVLKKKKFEKVQLFEMNF